MEITTTILYSPLNSKPVDTIQQIRLQIMLKDVFSTTVFLLTDSPPSTAEALHMELYRVAQKSKPLPNYQKIVFNLTMSLDFLIKLKK